MRCNIVITGSRGSSSSMVMPSSLGQDLAVQLEKLKGCDKSFKKRSGLDAGRPELKRCLEYLREGETLR
jgi:hypothetical protein